MSLDEVGLHLNSKLRYPGAKQAYISIDRKNKSVYHRFLPFEPKSHQFTCTELKQAKLEKRESAKCLLSKAIRFRSRCSSFEGSLGATSPPTPRSSSRPSRWTTAKTKSSCRSVKRCQKDRPRLVATFVVTLEINGSFVHFVEPNF